MIMINLFISEMLLKGGRSTRDHAVQSKLSKIMSQLSLRVSIRKYCSLYIIDEINLLNCVINPQMTVTLGFS